MSFKIITFTVFCVLVAGAHGAVVPHGSAIQEEPLSYLAAVQYGELPEDGMYYEYIQPVVVYDHEAPRNLEQYHERRKRQVSATVTGGNEGVTYLLRANKPIVGNEKHVLSAGASVAASSDTQKITTSAALNYENAKGHGASLTGTNIPGVGKQVSLAGKLNLLKTEKHNVDANAFHARTFLKDNGPTLKTNGGSLDYLFKNKHGASLGVSHTDLIKSTTYSGTGKFNLFKTPSISFDLTGGLSKTTSPFMPSTGWKPNYGFSFTKTW